MSFSVPGRALSLETLQHLARGTRKANDFFHAIDINLGGLPFICSSVIYHQLWVPG